MSKHEHDDKQDMVRLACRLPFTSFDPRVKGVDPITSTGTDVPADKADTIIAAGKRAGVTVIKSKG
jgi:hypothetical protein